jgi:hypothetical protein
VKPKKLTFAWLDHSPWAKPELLGVVPDETKIEDVELSDEDVCMRTNLKTGSISDLIQAHLEYHTEYDIS